MKQQQLINIFNDQVCCSKIKKKNKIHGSYQDDDDDDRGIKSFLNNNNDMWPIVFFLALSLK